MGLMATTVSAHVQLERDNGLVRDAVVNVWHFKIWQVDDIAACANILTALQAFYETIDGAMSPVLTGFGTVRFYDLAAALPRTPIFDGELSLTMDSSTPLPSECAIALSYRGTLVSGSPPARRRGRIFLGPWSIDALIQGDNDGLVNPTVQASIAGAAEVLMDEGSESSWTWAVFSPTTAGAPPWTAGELLGATLSVVAGHVDDAFDTIRSRGSTATTRETFS